MPNNSENNVTDILKELDLSTSNPSTYSSNTGWLGSDNDTIETINPSTGKNIANIHPCSELDVNIILDQAADTQITWKNVPAPKRGELIQCMGDLLRKHKDALGSLVALEMGKIKQEGDGEVQEMIDMADFAVGQSRMLYGNTMHSERPTHRMYEQWQPLGIVGVISAFNFPVAVWAWNAFIAAIAGNVVIWKPSSKTPLCAIAVQNICITAMNDLAYSGIFSLILPQNKSSIDKFVDDERVALLSFTGSSKTGNAVSVKVAKRMGRSLLECSGNNAIIICESADLNIAIPAVVFGAVGTAGQRCTSTRRLFVHESIYDGVKTRLISAYHQISIGDARNPSILLGPLIDQTAVDQFLNSIVDIKKYGEILVGGNQLNQPGYFVEPTIAEVKEQIDIVKHETFAPILYLMKYTDLDDAIYMQNDVSQGLSSAIFTENIKQAELFLSSRGSDCGIANVNIGTSGAEIGGAFGGEKATGGGREAGSDSWKAYMRRQTSTINWGNELPLAQGIKFHIEP